jgi:choice-of-anchor A domain-containing protein
MTQIAPRLVGLLLAMVVLTTGRAGATTLTDNQIFNRFNAVIFTNFSSSSDVQGRTVVGGNINSGGTKFEINSGLAASSFGALTVYGSVSGSTFQANNGGGIAIAGSNSANFNLNGGSATIGGSNSGNMSATGSLTVAGANSGTVSLTNGGSVYLGSNGSGGNFSVSGGGTTTVAINGNNAGTVTLANGSTLSLNGSNTGTIYANGGSVNYTGTQGNVTNVNGGTVTKVSSLAQTAPTSTLGSFATTFQTPLTQLSTQLKGVAANSTATVSNGALTFNANPNSSGIAAFAVNTSQFNGASSVAINLDGATSVIINVNVDSCVANVCTLAPSVNFNNDTSYAGTVLWNFVNATNLNFTTEIGDPSSPHRPR